MSDYACQIACAGCRKKGFCHRAPGDMPVMRIQDSLPVPAFLPTSGGDIPARYTYRETSAPRETENDILLACGEYMSWPIIVLIGTKGQQIFCETHKTYTRIKPERIAAAKRDHKRALAQQDTFDDIPPY